MLSFRGSCASWINSDGQGSRYGKTIQSEPKALSQRRDVPESSQAVATIAERNGCRSRTSCGPSFKPMFSNADRAYEDIARYIRRQQALQFDDHIALTGLDPLAMNARSTMPAPDGAGADARASIMGGALGDGLVTVELGHDVPEAMTLRRARAFPKVERIGPEAERKQQAQKGPAAMPASDGALSSGAWQAVHTNVPETGRRKCNDHS
ncbi:hypothetical protein MesoLj113a_30060 [Mesorhizobium sp. 113-1-2]|uniref:hypothetical protein n=1 Tax=Mesorhizobium sp. 113-1-2 TaxID=2744515 RepID=UPI0019291FB9|nr:hypothetical protein [Mesorhizobium sp. 113-1-2]BCG71848.1 hypothetical protein MesoLj113a_30060 [Mesorhizobium sp. 113-1-2]